MSEYAGMTAHYTKRRGKIRCCEWCGQAIAIGDKYASWLWYADGQRSTVYAHDECFDAWAEECHNDYGGVHHSDGQNQRPAKGENEMTEKQTNIHIAYCWRCDWSGSVPNGENICPSCQTLSLRHKSRHKIYCASRMSAE